MSPPPNLALRLREATRALHTEVERAGVMHQLLHSRLSRAGYCALLRNLHALYSSLEAALQHAAPAHPVLHDLVPPVLWRAPALEQDLMALHGPGWAQQLPLTTAAQAYGQHLHTLGRQQPLLLAAHAYVRYLGDLSGGQLLATRVARDLQLSPSHGVAFYSFGPAAAVDELKQAFRHCLLRVVEEPATSAPMSARSGAPSGAQPNAQRDAAPTARTLLEDGLVQEACSAFVRHRDLFEALAEAGGAA